MKYVLLTMEAPGSIPIPLPFEDEQRAKNALFEMNHGAGYAVPTSIGDKKIFKPFSVVYCEVLKKFIGGEEVKEG